MLVGGKGHSGFRGAGSYGLPDASVGVWSLSGTGNGNGAAVLQPLHCAVHDSS